MNVNTELYHMIPFGIKIRQQPLVGRRIGFIDTGTFLYVFLTRHPELVVQLFDVDAQGQECPDTSQKYYLLTRTLEKEYVCHIKLCAPDSTEDRSIVLKPEKYHTTRTVNRSYKTRGGTASPEPEEYYQVLVGKKTIPSSILNDPIDGKRKLFFVFSDLCIRIEGEYRIVVTVIDMSR